MFGAKRRPLIPLITVNSFLVAFLLLLACIIISPSPVYAQGGLVIPTTGDVTQLFLGTFSHETWFQYYYDQNNLLQPAPSGGAHSGVDLSDGSTDCQYPVYSAAAGIVVWAAFDDQGFGWSVVVQNPYNTGNNGNYTYTLYGHMGTSGGSNPPSQSCLAVTNGQSVNTGTLLGYQGESGDATGTHVHWMILAGPNGPTNLSNPYATGDYPASPDFYTCLQLTQGDSNSLAGQLVNTGQAACNSTPPPTITSTPPPTTCTDGATYVADVTVPDGTQMNPGQQFTKTWEMQNTGTCTWGSGYTLSFIAGDQLSSVTQISVPQVSPGSTVDLSVPMTAPGTPNPYTSYWQMNNASGQYFGDEIWAKIDVVPGTPVPTATPVPQPTATPPSGTSPDCTVNGLVLYQNSDFTGQCITILPGTSLSNTQGTSFQGYHSFKENGQWWHALICSQPNFGNCAVVPDDFGPNGQGNLDNESHHVGGNIESVQVSLPPTPLPTPTAISVPGGLQVCDGTNYGGNCTVLVVGRYSDLSSLGWSNRIESAQMVGDCLAQRCTSVLFTATNFTGALYYISTSSSQLPAPYYQGVQSINVYRNGPNLTAPPSNATYTEGDTIVLSWAGEGQSNGTTWPDEQFQVSLTTPNQGAIVYPWQTSPSLLLPTDLSPGSYTWSVAVQVPGDGVNCCSGGASSSAFTIDPAPTITPTFTPTLIPPTPTSTITSTPIAWSISLTPSANSVPAGTSVLLTAQTNVDVGTTADDLIILDTTTNEVVMRCATGTICTVPASEASPTSQTFVAEVVAPSGSPIETISNFVTVTWSQPASSVTSTATMTNTPTAMSTASAVPTLTSTPTIALSRTPPTSTPLLSATSTDTTTQTSTAIPTMTTPAEQTYTPTQTPTLGSTSTPTSTATVVTAATSTPIATATVISTIAPTPGATQVVTLPNNQGDIIVPGDDAVTSPMQATIRLIAPPTNIPSGLSSLVAIQIQFTNSSNGSVMHQLAEPVTIEISYAGLGLAQDQIDHLTIYNASENVFLPTTIDPTRQVAIAHSSQFSTFTLAQVTGPIPMVYLPVVFDNTSAGW